MLTGNRIAQSLLLQLGTVPAPKIPEALVEQLSSAIRLQDDRAVWYDDASAPFHPAHHDATGYEAFINHLHLDDFMVIRTQVEALQLGLVAVRILTASLERQHPARPFQISLSIDADSGTVVRFYQRREDQMLYAENLDGFEHDALLLFDVGSTPALPGTS